MCDYITTLTLENADRKVQEERITKLFSEVLNCGLSIVALRIKPGLLERSRLRNKSLLEKRNVVLIACTNQDELAAMMEEIKKIKLWHLPSIRFLIGNKELPDKLKKSYCKVPLTMENLRKNIYIEKLKDFIIGTCDPLDDEINIYGREQLKGIVCRVMELD